MTEFQLPAPVQKIVSRGKVTPEDVLYLRDRVFPVGLACDEDAMTIFALQNSCSDVCEEWQDFFIECLSNYIVSHVPPSGELDDANAAWVRRMLSTGGVLRTPLEVQCLLRALDVSVSVPESLFCLAVDQLRLAVVERRGGYAAMRATSRPGITRADMDYLNRLLVNRLFKNPRRLSDKELALLSRIDEAVAHAFNDPAWRSLMMSLNLTLENGKTVLVDWAQMAGASLWHQVDAA